MKPETPPANTIIATLYLLLLLATAYLSKRIFQRRPAQSARYSQHNYAPALQSDRMQAHLSPIPIVLKSFALKYSLVGAALNPDKMYLLKELFICSMVGAACCNINWVTLWPLALAVVFLGLGFVVMELFNYPALLKVDSRINVEQRPGFVEVANHNVQLEPGFGSEQQIAQNVAKQQTKPQTSVEHHSYKFQFFVGSILFITLVLVSQTMFSIYNSLSNLGALNLGSVASIIALDQLAIRPALGLGLFIALKLVLHFRNKSAQAANQAKIWSDVSLFDYTIIRNLSEHLLLQQMNQIYEQHGESEYAMGASPTRKKVNSPSKVPKAAPLLSDTETLIHLQQTKRVEQQLRDQQAIEELPQENMQDCRSPIKQIEMMMQESNIFTSAERKMFTYEDENDHNEMNRSATLDHMQKSKNHNQFFSAQRFPKHQLNPTDQMLEYDGLVLVEAGLNLIREPNFKEKPNTIDIDFSPNKRRRRAGINTKKRQLIITGSSPYLEYLPDMMKKEKNKKNLGTPSQTQIPTVSRKVL